MGEKTDPYLISNSHLFRIESDSNFHVVLDYLK